MTGEAVISKAIKKKTAGKKTAAGKKSKISAEKKLYPSDLSSHDKLQCGRCQAVISKDGQRR
jgi:hypothetical protein